MKNTNQKMKKWAVIAGLSLVCCVLVVLIGGKFTEKPPTDDISPNTPAVSSDVNPNPDGNAEGKDDMVVKPNTDSKPVDTSSADYTGTEQTIQPDPVKPKPPEKPDTSVDTSKPHEPPKDDTLTNPDKKPDSKPTPQEPPKTEKPQVGEGEIYIPGFGGVPNEGGGGKGEDSVLDPDHADFDKIIGY